MKTYCDTSALIVALHDETLRARLDNGEHVTRVHTLAELFSTLTGGRLRFKYTPAAASLLIEGLCPRLALVELDAAQTRAALADAGRRGVTGGRVHDWLHAVAAGQSGAERLLTSNVDDFRDLESGWTVEAV